jgi:hypothetical protein
MSDVPPDFPSGSIPAFPPDGPLEAPPVNLWFKIYIGLLGAMYLLILLAGIFFIVMGAISGDEDAIAMILVGVLYIGMGLILGVGYLLPIFLKPRPWVWIYGIVLIALSMTSLCCIPAAIPLVIYWIKDENRQYYGMK